MAESEIPILKIKGVVAAYMYTVPHGMIPLIIVTKKINWEALHVLDMWNQGCIILTKKDIQNGKDVFALRFLHMQQHTIFLGGKDLLASIEVEPTYARRDLETMLRVTLIDLREMMVQGTFSGGKQLALTIDRIYAYVPLIHQTEQGFTKQYKKSLQLCEKEHMNYKDMVYIYDMLVETTKQIDML